MAAEGMQLLVADADMHMHSLFADRAAERNDLRIDLFFIDRNAVRHPKPDEAQASGTGHNRRGGNLTLSANSVQSSLPDPVPAAL